jgi:hypothetical protein
VHSLTLRDLRNFKAQKDPSLPRSHLMDRAVFTIDLDAGAWGVGVGGGRMSERTSGSPEWVLRTRSTAQSPPSLLVTGRPARVDSLSPSSHWVW